MRSNDLQGRSIEVFIDHRRTKKKKKTNIFRRISLMGIIIILFMNI